MDNKGLLGKLLFLGIVFIGILFATLYFSAMKKVEITTGNVVVNLDFNTTPKPDNEQFPEQENQEEISIVNRENITFEITTNTTINYENLSLQETNTAQ